MQIPSEEERRVIKIDKAKLDGKFISRLIIGKLSDVKTGEIFYMEESDGELVVNDDGEFLFVAEADAIRDQATGFWGVEIKGVK